MSLCNTGSARVRACLVMTLSDATCAGYRVDDVRDSSVHAKVFFKRLICAATTQRVDEGDVRRTNCKIASLGSSWVINGYQPLWVIGMAPLNLTIKVKTIVTPLAPGAVVNSFAPIPVSRRIAMTV